MKLTGRLFQSSYTSFNRISICGAEATETDIRIMSVRVFATTSV